MGTEYEQLADEYYDEQLHPTIALLRAGSSAAIRSLLSSFLTDGAVFAEVGCGRGMLATLAPHGQVVSFDLNPGMLRHVPGVAILADATSLPVLGGAFDGILASLCDPYNTTAFIAEARRALRPGGRLLMTVPHHLWVRHNQALEGVVDAAVVVGASGPVTVPSFVHDPVEQTAILERHGFARVSVVMSSLADAMSATGISSPRLLDARGNAITPYIVDAYLAR